MQPGNERIGSATMPVRVLDAGEPVEDAELRPMRLPDGRLGALWRGQVFPLAADGSIDIAGPFAPAGGCRPWPQPTAGPRWSLLEGQEEAVLLLSGDALARDAVLAALRSAGLSVSRVGPVLDPELEADWALRLSVPPEGPSLRERIAMLVGESLAEPARPASEERLRLRLLEEQVHRLLAERDRLRGALEALRRAQSQERRATEWDRTHEHVEEREREVENARQEIEALRRALDEARLQTALGSVGGGERLQRRLRAEVEAFLEALPRIELVGDSVLTLLTDYRVRGAVYRVLGELQAGVELHRRFKPVRGRDGWWECHVATGQDDSGRIYACREADRWRVLVSIKEAQKRDLERLASLAGPSRGGR